MTYFFFFFFFRLFQFSHRKLNQVKKLNGHSFNIQFSLSPINRNLLLVSLWRLSLVKYQVTIEIKRTRGNYLLQITLGMTQIIWESHLMWRFASKSCWGTIQVVSHTRKIVVLNLLCVVKGFVSFQFKVATFNEIKLPLISGLRVS